MILTVTMNASVDITYVMNELKVDETNRVADIRKTAGGKGLNVTRVLNQVKADVMATGIIGGSTGQFICRQLKEQGIRYRFCEVSGESRNNISILHGNKFTEILEKGQRIEANELKEFLEIYCELLEKASTVVMSGSLPQGVPNYFYSQLVDIARKKGRRTILDTSGAYLKASLLPESRPFLIKPNEKELEELAGRRINLEDVEEVKEILFSPLFYGIEYIVVSLGAMGAIVKHGNEFWRVSVPRIKAVNPIGSGDSVIAGLALGFDYNEDMEHSIRKGMAFGVLNALESAPGQLKMENHADIVGKIRLCRV